MQHFNYLTDKISVYFHQLVFFFLDFTCHIQPPSVNPDITGVHAYIVTKNIK
jgi:hypothetical protein